MPGMVGIIGEESEEERRIVHTGAWISDFIVALLSFACAMFKSSVLTGALAKANRMHHACSMG